MTAAAQHLVPPGVIASSHVAGIDSIRALSALSVVLAHLAGPMLPSLFHKMGIFGLDVPEYTRYLFTGHPAVIVFFVVSGFCIHYPYTQKPLAILPFWFARLARIMIPVVVAIIFAMIARLREYNFWDGYILWSIVCELFYYFLYPLFLWMSRWLQWRWQFYLSLLVSCALVAVLGTDQYGNAHVYGPLLNWLVGLPSWLVGCVLAEQYRNRDPERQARAVEVWILRVLVAATASVLYWATLNTKFGYYITLNAFALVVYFWIRKEIGYPRPEGDLLEKVGKWSYSMYLMHMPLALIAARILKPVFGDVLTQLAVLPVVLFGCYFFFSKVEAPAHAYAKKIFKKTQDRGLTVSRMQRDSGKTFETVS